MKKTVKIISLILAFVLAFSLVLLTGCKKETPAEETTVEAEETTVEAEETSAEAEETAAEKIGEGATVFTFGVTFTDGSKKLYEVSTDCKTVGDALAELGVIEGEEGEFGLYVKTVAGETVDYDTDGKYWAFYTDGGYAATGISQTVAENGGNYEMKAE